MIRYIFSAFLFFAFTCSAISSRAVAQEVQLNTLGRFEGWRENALVGYGLVVGLSGSGDSRRSEITRQALRNVLSRLGTVVTEDQINSRNAAVVTAIATLPASANVGDRLPVIVSSVGDARSLAGGTLLMTPLLGPNQRTYALAQGPLVTGGYSFESFENRQQRNFPTTARLELGATVEAPVEANILNQNGELTFLLTDPNFTTARRISERINARFGEGVATAQNADEVRIQFLGIAQDLAAFVSELQSLRVQPDIEPRVVINERTGTIVAGGDVMLSSVVVAQGDVRVTITAENTGLQPSFISGFASDVSSLLITNTELYVEEGVSDVVAEFPSSTVADLVQGLNQAGIDTRGKISILQAIKSAGALHADIIIQ